MRIVLSVGGTTAALQVWRAERADTVQLVVGSKPVACVAIRVVLSCATARLSCALIGSAQLGGQAALTTLNTDIIAMTAGNCTAT